MGKVTSILRVDRQTACDVINEAAGAVLYDPPALIREKGRAPIPQAVDGAIRYSRGECEAYGRQLAERRAERKVRDVV